MALKIILLTGLPGSGKTVYCDNNYKEDNSYNNYTYVVHLDEFLNENREYSFYEDLKNDKENMITNIFRYMDNRDYTIVFDGLFPTYEDRRKFLSYIIDLYKLNNSKTSKLFNKELGRYKWTRVYKQVIVDIQEIYWNENRDACLVNDMHRNRHAMAKQTILKNQYDDPIPEDFFKNVDAYKDDRIIIHNPILMDVKQYSCEEGIWDCQRMINKNKKYSEDENVIASRWEDVEYFDSNFDEFDDFIENLCPEITFLQYKRIYKDSNVRIETSQRHDDYYSCSLTTYKRFVVNIEDIKKAFIKNNISFKS